jgi:hypothetical protein
MQTGILETIAPQVPCPQGKVHREGRALPAPHIDLPDGGGAGA